HSSRDPLFESAIPVVVGAIIDDNVIVPSFRAIKGELEGAVGGGRRPRADEHARPEPARSPEHDAEAPDGLAGLGEEDGAGGDDGGVGLAPEEVAAAEQEGEGEQERGPVHKPSPSSITP